MACNQDNHYLQRALFDLLAIVVLAGLYLWLSRRSPIAEAELVESHAGALVSVAFGPAE